MRRITALTITFLGIGILACGGGEEATENAVVDEKGANLNSPWKDMNLPVGAGEVLVDSTSMLLVGWESGDIDATTKDWNSAVSGAGWDKEEELISGSTGAIHTAIIYKKDSSHVGLATGIEDGIVFAYMEDLGKIADGDSNIKNPDRRGRINDDVRSRKRGAKGGGKGGGGDKAGKGGGGGGDKAGKGGKGGKGNKGGKGR